MMPGTVRRARSSRIGIALRRLAWLPLIAGGATACGTLWGFEDPVDMRDAASNEGATDLRSTDDASADADDEARAGEARGDVEPASATRIDSGAPLGDAEDAGDLADGALEDAGLGDGPPSDASAHDDALDEADALEAAPDAMSHGCATPCAPPVPGGGWEGPVEAFEGDGGPVPLCGVDGSWTLLLDLGGLPATVPAACSCSCGPVTGATCSTTASYFYDPACNTPCAGGQATRLGASCTPMFNSNCNGASYYEVTALASGGTCATATLVQRSNPTWGVTLRLCGVSGGLSPCEAGDCTPPPDPAFERTYCIAHTGDVTCPSNAYPRRRTYDDAGSPFYASANDSRGCTECACGPPTGTACGISAQAYAGGHGGGLCSGPSVAMPACTPVGSYPYATADAGVPDRLPDAGPNGHCATTPDGGQPIGAIVPTAPYTVCCTP